MKRRSRRPAQRRLGRALWQLVALVSAAHFALPYITHLVQRPETPFAAALLALALVAFVVRRVRRWVHRRRRMRAARVSDQRRDYLIEGGDYRRGNAKEYAYRRVMQLTLLATFDNACAKCGARDDGVDLDHFFWPKNAGGCFIMRHADGYLVNNAVPLCMHCNRAKSDRSYREFFSADQLTLILERNRRMTQLLNERAPVDRDGHVHARVRRAAA